MRVALLTNPAAGRGAGMRNAQAVLGRLRAKGITVSLLQGNCAAESVSLASAAVRDGIDALAVVGGDGLVADVLPVVAGTSVALGVVPTGTGNDLAREFGIPRSDPLAAADVIVARRTRQIDLGTIRGTWFATVIAGGFDARVNQRANTMRWPTGRMRYNAAIAVEFAALRPISYRIELDGEQAIEVSAVLVAIGNTSTYGGGMRICANADPADGLLDITVVRAVGRLRLALLMRHLYDDQWDHPAVNTYRARSVSLSAAGQVSAFADGEPRGPLPLTATAVPGALSLLVP